MENFDFDTFLDNDAEFGPGFDPRIADETGVSAEAPLEENKPGKRDPEKPPPLGDVSLDNPDIWILRWTTLRKEELH